MFHVNVDLLLAVFCLCSLFSIFVIFFLFWKFEHHYVTEFSSVVLSPALFFRVGKSRRPYKNHFDVLLYVYLYLLFAFVVIASVT